MTRFAEDFDSGMTKRQVLHKAQEGWERLGSREAPRLFFPLECRSATRHYRRSRSMSSSLRAWSRLSLRPAKARGVMICCGEYSIVLCSIFSLFSDKQT